MEKVGAQMRTTEPGPQEEGRKRLHSADLDPVSMVDYYRATV